MDSQGKAKVALTFALYQGEQLIRRDTIVQDIVKVGKDPRSHLRVDDELASRMHAVIEVASPTDITLIDLGNEPGTLVNGQRVNKCKIRPGDQIQIGSTLDSARERRSRSRERGERCAAARRDCFRLRAPPSQRAPRNRRRPAVPAGSAEPLRARLRRRRAAVRTLLPPLRRRSPIRSRRRRLLRGPIRSWRRPSPRRRMGSAPSPWTSIRTSRSPTR